MRILIASPIYNETIEYLKENHEVVCAFNANTEDLKSSIKKCNAIVFRSGVQITADVMKCSPDLKLVIRAGSGIDNLDTDYVLENKIHLERIPEPGARAVAEMTFSLMLALARNVIQADRLLRWGKWTKHELTGYLLENKTLGIIGTGNIGSVVGQMGSAWGMNVIGCMINPTSNDISYLKSKGIHLTSFEEVLENSDFLTIHVPLDNSTANFINEENLSKIKHGAFIINMSRGGIVDEDALYVELKNNNRLRGAALDVHKEEGNGKISKLAGLPNVILTPHIGASTIDTQSQIGQRIKDIIDSFRI